MKTQTVYIETTIISYLAGRPSHDLLTAACQQATRDWWEGCRSKYELYTSQLVIVEAGAGDSEAAKKRLGLLEGIPQLGVNDQVRDLAKALITQGALPQKAETDALHIVESDGE
jgi:hypothetical protein